MSVSQKQIAETLNLSAGTVSRSLHGHPDIHPKTRKKVIELASRMGYQPSRAFRRRNEAATGKLVTIGVAVCWSRETAQDVSSAAYHMLAGISEATAKISISMDTRFLSLENCRKTANLQDCFPAMRADMLSGLLLIYHFPHDIVQDFARLVPCVSLVHPHLDLGVDCIDNDQAEGISMVVDHLYRLGHRRIGFLSLPMVSDRSWISIRFAGYMRAMRRLGMPLESSNTFNIFGSDISREAVVDAIADHRRHGVTAWVCADDNVGYDLYPLLTARGLRVPQDISLAGFSGLTPPLENCPRLTSVHPPFEKMGIAAVQRLFHRIKHPDEPVCHVQFGCKFIEGKTTGPPARP